MKKSTKRALVITYISLTVFAIAFIAITAAVSMNFAGGEKPSGQVDQQKNVLTTEETEALKESLKKSIASYFEGGMYEPVFDDAFSIITSEYVAKKSLYKGHEDETNKIVYVRANIKLNLKQPGYDRLADSREVHWVFGLFEVRQAEYSPTLGWHTGGGVFDDDKTQPSPFDLKALPEKNP